jgi:tetratricopeptide (TPR) repeat protein
VVYRAIPKQRRADLHQGFASWLQRTSEWLNEETVGWHLERSYLLRRELGVRGEGQRALGERAAALLTASGQRARSRGDLPSATGLLRRAAPLWPQGTRGRVRNLIDLATCLIDAGEMRGAEDRLHEAVAEAESTGDRALQARASVTLWEARSSTHNVAGWRDRALEEARRALAVFEDEGDEVGLSLAHRLEAMIHQNDYRFAAAERALEEALRHARSAGDEHEERKILEWYTMSALWGPTPVDEAIARHEDFRRRFGENRLVEAGCLRRIAGFKAMQGSIEEARELLAQSRAILNDLGAGLLAAVTVTPGLVELLAGNPRAAEKDFRASYEALERLGESNARVVSAAYLARALYEQGRYDEAEKYVEVSAALTPADDLAARTEWAPVKAKLLARRSQMKAAEMLAREAVALAEATDDISNHAATLADLAEVLRLDGRTEEARDFARQAVELYERKGNVVLADRTRALAELH